MCVCVCVCVEEECRLAPSHSAKYLSVTFGALVTCVCECVCECVVCVSPFCCTTVGVLPSVSSWESDLWVCEVLCVQWHSYTRAHTGLGPGEFLRALVNHLRSTYLNPVA